MGSLNRGIDWKRQIIELDPERDHVFGALSQPCVMSVPEDLRETVLPVGETQFGVEDFMDCATRAPLNILETKFTYWYKTGMKEENRSWLELHGYIQNGHVTFSDRFIAILSGTTKQGNSLKAPLQAIHEFGLIPKTLLPKGSTMTFAQYHDNSMITQAMKDMGSEFKRRFPIEYELVLETHYADLLTDDMLDVAGYAWPSPINGVYPNPGDKEPNHAFMVVRKPKYNIYDNYEESPNDFIKVLTSDYNLYDYGYRVKVVSEAGDPTPITPNTIFEFIKKILILLKFQFITVPEPVVVPAPISNKEAALISMCLAIREFEGWYTGSRSQRNNNPGNVKYSTVGYLPIYGEVRKDMKGFAVFKDYETGWMYLKNLILSKAKAHPSWSLVTLFNEYAPNSDGNDHERYATFVGKKMGVNPFTWTLNNLL